MECYHDENELLKGRVERLQNDIKKIESYVTYMENEFITLRKRLKDVFFDTPDSKALAEMLRILEAKP